jgi:hypothetical protein
VARWTGEIQENLALRAALLDDKLWLTLSDALSTHPLGPRQVLGSERDELGLFWLPDLDAPGTGEPQFAGLHTGRLRASMLDRICQVCGVPFPSKEPVTFLDSAYLNDPNTGRTQAPTESHRPYITPTPPTCRSCIPVAMQMCPHNRGKEASRIIVSAHRYRPFAAKGDLYGIHKGVVEEEERGAVVQISDPRVSRLVVKQVYVQVIKYTTEPVTARASSRPSQ